MRRDAGDADGITAGIARKSRRDSLFKSAHQEVSDLPPLGTNVAADALPEWDASGG